jgi:hypothetical protein
MHLPLGEKEEACRHAPNKRHCECGEKTGKESCFIHKACGKRNDSDSTRALSTILTIDFTEFVTTVDYYTGVIRTLPT